MKNKILVLLFFLLVPCSISLGIGVDVVLKNGKSLRGELLSCDEQKIVFKHPDFRENVRLLRNNVRSLYFNRTGVTDLGMNDKVFPAVDGWDDVLSCRVETISSETVVFTDLSGKRYQLPRQAVSAIQLGSSSERPCWSEPYVFADRLDAKLTKDGWLYPLPCSQIGTMRPLCNEVALNLHSFTFRTGFRAMPLRNNNPQFALGAFYFGGIPGDSDKTGTCLALKIYANRCELQKISTHENISVVLGRFPLKESDPEKGIDILVTSYPDDFGMQVFEWWIDRNSGGLIKTDPLVLSGREESELNTFAFQMEAPLTECELKNLQLATLVTKPSSSLMNASEGADSVQTVEDDRIPCEIRGYRQENGLLHVRLLRKEGGIPSELSIPRAYADFVRFGKTESLIPEESVSRSCVVLRDGSHLHARLLRMEGKSFLIHHDVFGQIRRPIDCISYIDFDVRMNPKRSGP